MKYQNKRNGKVAVEVELNERTKVYTIVFEDGTSTACTTSTFKRWYKKLDEEPVVTEEPTVQDAVEEQDEESKYVAEIMEQKKELGIECPSINEVEIAEQAKQKAKAVRKVTPNVAIAENRDFVRHTLQSLELTVLEYEKLPGLFVVKIGKKTICEVKAGRAISINFREADATDLTADYHKVSNYYLPCVYKLTDATDIKVILNDLKNNYTTLTKEEK